MEETPCGYGDVAKQIGKLNVFMATAGLAKKQQVDQKKEEVANTVQLHLYSSPFYFTTLYSETTLEYKTTLFGHNLPICVQMTFIFRPHAILL